VEWHVGDNMELSTRQLRWMIVAGHGGDGSLLKIVNLGVR
jgi:hypothetical protein